MFFILMTTIYKFDTWEVSKDHQNAKYEFECEIQDVVVQNNFKECSCNARIRLILAAHFPFANQLKQIILTEQPTFFASDMSRCCAKFQHNLWDLEPNSNLNALFFKQLPNKMKNAIQSCIKDLTGHFSGRKHFAPGYHIF